MTDGRCPQPDAILDYVDGHLATGDRVAIEAHLAECDECRRVVAEVASGTASADLFARGVLSTGAHVGRYVVLRLIGRGGMGVVYEAWDPELDRHVAVKLVSIDDRASDPAEAQDRLLREAQALAALGHPNVVRVYDVGRYGEDLYVAMERIVGASVTTWRAAAPRTPDEIVDVFCAAGRGLAAAHAAGFVHRDVKPDNILVGDDGVVSVVDFGLAQAAGPSADAPPASPQAFLRRDPLTRTGTTLGTPAFMAPEQARGADVDARSDQYSFCASLYWALFDAFAPDDGAVVVAGLAGLTERRRRALERGLARDPEDRFASMDALLDAFAPVRRRWAGIAAAAAAALVVGVGISSWAQRPDCDGGAEIVSAMWGPAAAEAVEAGVGSDEGRAAVARIDAALTDFGATWARTHRAACAATRIDGHQSEESMASKMACLEHMRRRAEVLVSALEAPEVMQEDLHHVVEVARNLPDPERCDRPGQAMDLPRDPARRAEVEALDGRLGALEGQLALGRLDRGDEVEPVLAQARALGHAPLEASASLLLGRFGRARGDTQVAEAALRSAIRGAARSGQDRVAAEAWTELVAVLTDREAFEAAREAAEAALATIARAGGDLRLESRARRVLGNAATWELDYDVAVPALRAAVAAARRAGPSGRAAFAQAASMLGQSLVEVGAYAEARSIAAVSLDASEALFGAEHPFTNEARFTLGLAQSFDGDLAGGLARMRAALARDRALRGAHPIHVYGYNEIASALTRLDRCSEALEVYGSAFSLARRTLGARSYGVALLHRDALSCRLRTGRHAEARAGLASALDIAEGLRGPDHPATTLIRLGWVELEAAEGRPAAAQKRLEAVQARLRSPSRWLTTKVEAVARALADGAYGADGTRTTPRAPTSLGTAP